MAILTNSRKVLDAQRRVIERLLSKGIHNCAVCPKYGACELQDAAFYLGIELDMTGPELGSDLVSWFAAPYWNAFHGIGKEGSRDIPAHLELEVDDTDEFIRVNFDRCVLCGRCVKACRMAGRDVIHFANRGRRTRIIFDNDVSLGMSACDHCLRCVEICPVGCLVEKNTAWQS